MTTTTVVEQSQGKIRPLSLNGVIPSAENVERKIYTLIYTLTRLVPRHESAAPSRRLQVC